MEILSISLDSVIEFLTKFFDLSGKLRECYVSHLMSLFPCLFSCFSIRLLICSLLCFFLYLLLRLLLSGM